MVYAIAGLRIEVQVEQLWVGETLRRDGPPGGLQHGDEDQDLARRG